MNPPQPFGRMRSRPILASEANAAARITPLIRRIPKTPCTYNVRPARHLLIAPRGPLSALPGSQEVIPLGIIRVQIPPREPAGPYPPGRRCAAPDCITVLRTTNPGPLCEQCALREERGDYAELMGTAA